MMQFSLEIASLVGIDGRLNNEANKGFNVLHPVHIPA